MRRLGAHALRLGACAALLLLAACGPDTRVDAPSFEHATYAYVADDLPWTATIDGTHDRVADSAPAVVLDWAPDGRLAWLEASDGCGCKIQAWVADDRSSRLVAAFNPPSTGPRHLLALRWSPAGEALAGLYGGPSSLSHDAEVNEFFVVDLQEPEPTRARGIGNPGGEGFPPVWSPDGNAVIGLAWVFDSNPDDDSPGLFLHDLVTDEVRIPAIGRVRGTHPPAWSPNGQRIAFATPRAGTLDIHVADSPEAQSTPLLDGACDDLNPRWISDGDTLLVRRYCPDTAPQDVVIDADTGAILSTIAGLPAWAELSPDGTRALWTETVPGQRDGDIVVYDLATEHVVERIRGRNPRWRPALGDP